MNCKACGNEVPTGYLLKEFCSDICFWEYEDLMKSVDKEDVVREKQVYNKQPLLFEGVIKRKGKFYISNKTLENIKNSADKFKLQKLLKDYSCIIIKCKFNNLSLIKKIV